MKSEAEENAEFWAEVQSPLAEIPIDMPEMEQLTPLVVKPDCLPECLICHKDATPEQKRNNRRVAMNLFKMFKPEIDKHGLRSDFVEIVRESLKEGYCAVQSVQIALDTLAIE